MKTLLVAFLGLFFTALNLVGVTPDVLPALRVPRSVTFDKGSSGDTTQDAVMVSEKEVFYSAMDKKNSLWIGFRADHKGNLLGFHIVQVDTCIFQWESVPSDSNSARTNKVRTDVEGWKKLFRNKVVFNRPIEYSK